MNWSTDWSAYDTWIVVTAMLSACACALLGNYLILRRMSLMGDAISHAVLPGLAIAFLVTGSRNSLPMLAGAALIGVLTAVLTQFVHSLGRVDQSASMGIVFTSLFAVGLILIERTAHHVDLDPGCVLYGAIELTPLDTVSLMGWMVPRAALVLAFVLLLDATFVLLFYKELMISSFDPTLATTLGIPANVMHYALMGMVAVTAVASFESVGSILVIAMLIVPGATAHLLTDRLSWMLIFSMIIAAASAVLGHVSAIIVPTWFGYPGTNTAGMMAVVAGLLFSVTAAIAPRYGIISRLVRRMRLALSIVSEDVLGMLYRMEELNSQPAKLPGRNFREALLAGPVTLRLALSNLVRTGRLSSASDGYELTTSGRARARDLVRSHRLWESWLARHLHLAADHVHIPAERLEHITDQAMRESLSADVDQSEQDPHGKEIPPESLIRSVKPQSGRVG